MVLQRDRRAEHRHDAVTGGLVHGAAVTLHHRSAAVGQLGHDLAQPLRTNTAAMSIECTTSANSTVTCLYSAAVAVGLTGAPHLLQNLESGGRCVPHDPHDGPAAVSAPRPSSPLGSTSVSCHRWSTVSGRLRVHRVDRGAFFAVINTASSVPARVDD